MKIIPTIKFRDVVEVLTEGTCYVCVDAGDNRENCIEDHLRSREMLVAAVSALGDYNVIGITTTMDEPCFILRRPGDVR